MRLYKWLKLKYMKAVKFEFVKRKDIPQLISIGEGTLISKYRGGKLVFGQNLTICNHCKIASCGGKLHIGNNTQIGDKCYITAQGGVNIGNFVLFADEVKIIANEHNYEDVNIPIMNQGCNTDGKCISIGDGSWLGIGSIILGGTSIGKNCVVGAGSIVKGKFPDNTVIAGNPAKIIKRYKGGKWERENL